MTGYRLSVTEITDTLRDASRLRGGAALHEAQHQHDGARDEVERVQRPDRAERQAEHVERVDDVSDVDHRDARQAVRRDVAGAQGFAEHGQVADREDDGRYRACDQRDVHSATVGAGARAPRRAKSPSSADAAHGSLCVDAGRRPTLRPARSRTRRRSPRCGWRCRACRRCWRGAARRSSRSATASRRCHGS